VSSEKFLASIDEEIMRLRGELEKVKQNIVAAQQIVEEANQKQRRLAEEMKAVDMMKVTLVNFGQQQQPQQQEPVYETQESNQTEDEEQY
jgi:hypothetical protein